MKHILAAFWAERLKARRSKVPWLAGAGFMILPLVSGLFMVILKDPVRAKDLGLISMKAQLTGGTADWQSFFGMLTMGTGIAGLIIFSLITTWIFGREFADQTLKELLALPTPRWAIVAAKLLLSLLMPLGMTIIAFVLALGIGVWVDIPGYSPELLRESSMTLFQIAALTVMLMPMVAFIASIGRGYLPPTGWTFLTLAFSQIATVMGWGEWFPWAVPSLLSEFSGTAHQPLSLDSFLVVLFTFLLGTVATLLWWQRADHAK